MGAVTTYRTQAVAEAPGEMTKALSDRLTFIEAKMERHGSVGYAIPDTAMPNPVDWDAMKRRRDRLARSLTPADPSQIVLAISQMFSAWPSARYDLETTARMASTYAATVSSLPQWAIDAGVLAIVKAGGSFAPSAGDFAAECGRQAAPAKKELDRLTRVLSAEVFHVPTDDEKARIVAGFAELQAQMSAPTGDGRTPFKSEKQIKAEANAWLEKARENPAALPQLSDAALKAAGFVVKSKGEGEAA